MPTKCTSSDGQLALEEACVNSDSVGYLPKVGIGTRRYQRDYLRYLS